MTIRSPADLSFSVSVNDYKAKLNIRISLDFKEVFINSKFFKSLTVKDIIIAHFKRKTN